MYIPISYVFLVMYAICKQSPCAVVKKNFFFFLHLVAISLIQKSIIGLIVFTNSPTYAFAPLQHVGQGITTNPNLVITPFPHCLQCHFCYSEPVTMSVIKHF